MNQEELTNAFENLRNEVVRNTNGKPLLGRDRTANKKYSAMYQKMVKAGLRAQIKRKYR